MDSAPHAAPGRSCSQGRCAPPTAATQFPQPRMLDRCPRSRSQRAERMNATSWPTLNARLPPDAPDFEGSPGAHDAASSVSVQAPLAGETIRVTEQVHNRTYRAVRQDRTLLGRTTDSVVLLERGSLPRGQQKVLNRDDNRKGVSSDEPDQQADVSADLRGSRSSPRVTEDRVPVGPGRQASLPADLGGPPALPGQRDPGPGGRAADVADDRRASSGRVPVRLPRAGPARLGPPVACGARP